MSNSENVLEESQDESTSRGVIPSKYKKCIWCDESISKLAKVCKECERSQNPWIARLSAWHIFEIFAIIVAATSAYAAYDQANDARKNLVTVEEVKKETAALNDQIEDARKGLTEDIGNLENTVSTFESILSASVMEQYIGKLGHLKMLHSLNEIACEKSILTNNELKLGLCLDSELNFRAAAVTTYEYLSLIHI